MTPPALLRIELDRRRTCGETFESAWADAIEHALAGVTHLEEWRAASRSKFAFENAYCRRGTARLAAAIRARELAEVVAETVLHRGCWWPPAGRLIPETVARRFRGD